MQKEADDGGFGASASGFDAVSSVDSSSVEDIVGSGSEHEKFVIKGGLHPSDSSESSNRSDCKKTKNGYDAFGKAWDSTVNFLKHPWTSMHTESNHPIEEKMESNEVLPKNVNFAKNKTSSAWENTTNFAPGIANTEMGTDIFDVIRGHNGAPRSQDLQAI